MADTKRIPSLLAFGPYSTRQITLLSGQNLKAGTLLGKITTGGKYTESTATAIDGSETPDLVLAEDCDASSGDKVTLAYETGGFNVDEMTIHVTHTVASIREGLRLKGILLANVD